MMFCFPQYRANHRGPHLPQYPATVMEGFVHQTYNTANIYLQPKHMSDVVLLARPRVAPPRRREIFSERVCIVFG
jgi:hypothetical protein